MGSHSPQKDLSVFHFSHPHPLELTTSPPTPKATCFACNLHFSSGKSYYSCKSCAFSLHHFCYKLPIITHHPSHSTHDLVLLVIRSSPAPPRGTVKCVACGLHVTAFCYHCAECSIYFHTFCLALPLSLSITYHPHNVKLEFSPPYDFCCDLCKTPSFNGWLYRCSLCEFDTHLACAVQNLEPHWLHLHHPSFSQSNTLLAKITGPDPPQARFNGGAGDNNSTGIGAISEIMHLIAQQVGGETRGSDDGAVVGWDERVYSPRQSGKTKMVELQEQTEPSPATNPANLQEKTPLRDKMTPRSDLSTPQSYQFSDACFSIDLAKSYQETRDGVEHKGTSRTVSNSEEGREAFGIVNWPSFNSYNAAQQKRLMDSTKHPITKSDAEKYSSRSGWRKCLSCCP